MARASHPSLQHYPAIPCKKRHLRLSHYALAAVLQAGVDSLYE